MYIPMEKVGRFLILHGVRSLTTIEAIKDRLVEITEAYDKELSCAVPVSDMARRFARPMKSMPVTMTELAAQLGEEGRVILVHYKGRNWLFSNSMNETIENMRDITGEQDSAVNKERLIELWTRNALIKA